MRKRWTRWGLLGQEVCDGAGVAGRLGRGHLSRSTAARSSSSSCASTARFGGRRMLPLDELWFDGFGLRTAVRDLAGRGLAGAERRPPRGRGSGAREELLALRGAGRLRQRARKLSGDGAATLAAAARRGRAARLQARRRARADAARAAPVRGRGRRARRARRRVRGLLHEPEGARARDGASWPARTSTSSRWPSARSPTASAATTRSSCCTPTTPTTRDPGRRPRAVVLAGRPRLHRRRASTSRRAASPRCASRTVGRAARAAAPARARDDRAGLVAR